MERTKFASLVGAELNGIRWGRPILFFAALFFSDISYLFIQPLVNFLIPAYGEKYLSSTWLSSPLSWAQSIFTNILFAFLLLAIFRWIRNDLLAVLAATILNIPVRLLSYFLTSAIITLSYGSSTSTPTPWLWIMLVGFIDTVSLVGGIILALLIIRRVWLALFLGSFFNLIILRSFFLIYNLIFSDEIKIRDEVEFFVFGLIGTIIFALFFGIIWWLTADQTPSGEHVKPRLSKEFYAGTWAACLSVSMVLIMVLTAGLLTNNWLQYNYISASILLLFTFLISLYSLVVFFVVIYKMWSAIQGGFVRTTPGQAIGYLFIPVYSLYWIFQVFPGFTQDYNDFIDQYQINVPKLSSGLFTAYCVLALLAGFPLIGIFAAFANLFVGTAMISKICDAVNAIPTEINYKSKQSNSGILNLG